MLQLAGEQQRLALLDEQHGNTAAVLGAVARRPGEAQRGFVERQHPLGPTRRELPMGGGRFGVDRTGLFQMIGDHGMERVVDREPLLEHRSDTEMQFGSTHRIDAIEDDIANEVVTEPVPIRGVVAGDQPNGRRRRETGDQLRSTPHRRFRPRRQR